MASAIVFILHIIFIFTIFFIKKKNESLSSAFQNVILIIILFAIAWAFITMIVNQLIEPQGFGKEFDRDGISLVIVTIIESIFYYKYYKKDLVTEAGKEIQ
ncbi:MAG: hypothetical protein HND52_02295 [Ignavibacteriae bacterium]|jgi:uncharacterized membrane protein|nr:hypothetical protein [Ignavibacteriota bacterium]NOG96780.1 hypothetical protein [Ignavibacteriota bacterium]